MSDALEYSMSALDKAVAELDAKRSKDDAERRSRQQAATTFLKEFFDADDRGLRRTSPSARSIHSQGRGLRGRGGRRLRLGHGSGLKGA